MEPQEQTLVGQGVEWIDDYNDVAASAWSDIIPCHSFLQGGEKGCNDKPWRGEYCVS